jgi:hypothetical protein
MKNRLPLIPRMSVVCLLALSAAGCSSGTTRPSAAAEPAAAASTAAPARELTDTTCAEYLDLVEQVKLESQASGAAKAQDAQDAQDALVETMLWLHGYLSGRNGIDNQARPLTRDWLASSVGVLARACAVDENRRVVDVVAGIQ